LAAGASRISVQGVIDRLLHKEISRGQFISLGLLVGGGGAVSAIDWATLSRKTKRMRHALQQLGVLTSDLPERQQADLLGYGLLDWRDAASAKGVTAAMKAFGGEFNPQEESSMFQGEAHGGMIEYLKKPERRERKLNFYFHYHITGETSVRRYTYYKPANEWREIQRIPY